MIPNREELEMLRKVDSTYIFCRLPSGTARDRLKRHGLITGGKSRNWTADGRTTYWTITDEGRAVLARHR